MPTETDTDKIERLEARIVELENALKALLEPVDISADEIRTYRKVRNALECDIRHCSPVRCIPMACSAPHCSPRDIGEVGGRGLERFTDLGS
jgi:hypothetical protein